MGAKMKVFVKGKPRETKRNRGAGTIAVTTALVLGSALCLGAPAVAAPTRAETEDIQSRAIIPAFPVQANGVTLGQIESASQDGATVTLTAQRGAIRVSFLDEGAFRVEGALNGEFTDPANTDEGDPQRSANIIVGSEDFAGATPTLTEGEVIVIATPEARLEITKADGSMALYDGSGSLVWEESRPTTYASSSTTQYLAKQDLEQFVGGGMQNGRSVHTYQTINVTKDTNWVDGGNPSAVPYYMSSKGYGVLRNTFAGGTYDFMDEVTTTHGEKRFDAYYFVGGFKQSLDSYTKLTGRPLMPPVYALEYGDADCYNRSNPAYQERNPTWATMFRTQDKLVTKDAAKIAQELRDNDLPTGWMLVNDGYSCEYQDLPGAVDDIKDVGLETGLWTQRSLTAQEHEVGEAGISLRKLDVAWVGAGYRLALTGCEAAYNGIEQYSDRRGVSIMVEGWAGSQRCGMQWTGDHSGNLDAVRWQVSALSGAGMSGQAFTLGDVDGIFGGSEESYVRDLQWKAFAPALYSMSGWTGGRDKRPYDWGVDAESTAINRQYLYERQQLMPYIYTLAEEAHRTGTPVMRHLALEYPEAALSYGPEANNEYLLGQDLLVAPVFTSTDVRNGIALPEGKWVDYWTGDVFGGNTVRNGHAAPLDRLPVFVRAGAVIPYAARAFNTSEVAEDSALSVHVYPKGESSFTLYEDDGVTRDYQSGTSARQTFSVQAPEVDDGDVAVTIGQRQGSYNGMAPGRPYEVVAHTSTAPSTVLVDGETVPEITSEQWDQGENGWWFDPEETAGVIKVRVETLANGSEQTITMKDTSVVGGSNTDGTSTRLNVDAPQRVIPDVPVLVTVPFDNYGDYAKRQVSIELDLPEGWELISDYATKPGTVAPGGTATAQYVLKASDMALAGETKLGASATYVDRLGQSYQTSALGTTEVAYSSLAESYNFTAITSIDQTKSGNFGGGGASFADTAIADALGGKHEVTVEVAGGDIAEVAWPDTIVANQANSTSLTGQTVAVTGAGTHLAILGSAATASGVNAGLILNYSDGTSSTADVFFPNWLYQSGPGLQGSYFALDSMGRHATNEDGSGRLEYPAYKYSVYLGLAELDSGKELQSVTFPQASSARIFAWEVVETPSALTTEGPGIWASDLPYEFVSNGWGHPQADKANKDSADGPDVPLRLGGNIYDKGFGVHAPATTVVEVGAGCTTFLSDVGIEQTWTGTLKPQVDVDGETKWTGKEMKQADGGAKVEVDVSGASTVALIMNQVGSGNGGAHGVWGNARFLGCDDAVEVPPVIPETSMGLAPANPDGNEGWYRNAPQVRLVPGGTTPQEATNFRYLTGGLFHPYAMPFTLPDGTWNLEYYTYSKSTGAKEDIQTSPTLKVDTTPPRVWAEVDTSARTAELFAEDEGSGVDAIYYSLDEGETFLTYVYPIVADSEAKVTILFYAADKAGNLSQIETTEIPRLAEATAPVTVVDVQGLKGDDNWFIDTPKVTVSVLSASADIESIHYSLDGENWMAYTEPFDLADGEHILYHYAVDVNGLAGEPASTNAYYVDTAPPEVDATVDLERRSVTLSATDATSGVHKVEYSLDNGQTWLEYTTPVKAPTGGFSLMARATDKAGNTSSPIGPFEIPAKEDLALPDAPQPAINSGATTHNSITVEWEAVDNADSYVVKYEDEAAQVRSLTTVETEDTSLVLSELQSDTEHTIWVHAVNAAGMSDPSESLIERTKVEPAGVVPEAPGQVSVSEVTSSTAQVQWEAVPDADSYLVTYWAGMETFTVETDKSSVQLTDLLSNTDYLVSAQAVNSVGSSPASTEVAFTTLEAVVTVVPESPTGLETADVSSEAITLKWESAAGATGYRVVVKGANGTVATYDNASTPLLVEGLEADTEYTFTVWAFNEVAISEPSEPLTATTLGASIGLIPDMPINLQAIVVGADSATLTWDPVVGAQAYRADYTSGTRHAAASVTVSATVVTLSELEADTDYAITVTALAEAGESDPSEVLRIHTLKTDGAGESGTPGPGSGSQGGAGGGDLSATGASVPLALAITFVFAAVGAAALSWARRWHP